ncbi:uncharacterized protein LOC121859729 isoform X3 [Homarus americanus]|uniref:uncharacterized protein LOC121859729 isoform X3 n=1 Tax=Homarus americanus TaxID=6706 RepID=UPI001C44890B|nr:uncharacterized protein LOC121859729 isoform X3 [Homarus americanus]
MSGRHHHPCVVCTRTKTDHPVLVFHVFPKDRKRCLQWLSAVNQPILHKKTYEQLNRSCNICSFHFSPKNYINGTPHSRLTKLACPDQNLTDNARDSSSIAANCSYESAFDGSTQGSGNIEKEISVDYTTDVRPRDLQYDFDDLDLASTVEFDVILTRESWDPAFPDPALSGKEVVTRQSELDGNSARTIPPPPPVTPGKSETYRTKSLCPALPAPVVSVDERIAGHSECVTLI